MIRIGLYLIIMALMFHWLGAKMQQTRISLISFILIFIPGWFSARKVSSFKPIDAIRWVK